nr:AhpC/TSA family protein [Acidimicrobiia bacterium]
AFRAGIGARWLFLSDAERRCIGDLGLVEVTDTTNRPYLPTVYTLFPDRTINSVYNGYWFWGRPTAQELWRDFRQISSEIRPDWDPPTS